MSELDDPIVVCNEEHRFIVAENLREINVKPNSIILEKVAKNTCPAITLSALKALQLANDPVVLVFPADHLIEDNASFLKSLKIAIEISLTGKIVTLGVLPTSPETGFGYIESKEELNFKTLKGIEIKKFIEKPNKNIAENAPVDVAFIAETGGLNAMIVDSTALPEQAIKDIISSSFQSAGQRCSALRILYLQEDIADEFMEMLFGAMDELVVSDPWLLSTDIGPVIDKNAKERINTYIKEAEDKKCILKNLTVIILNYMFLQLLSALTELKIWKRKYSGQSFT